MMSRRATVGAIALSLLSACAPQPRSGPPALRIPNAERGRSLASTRGCAACHVIPGVNAADGLIGPPLTHWSQRQYIAGVLPNTPAQLQRWIRQPQLVKPGIAMPNIALSDSDAADIAAYLLSRP